MIITAAMQYRQYGGHGHLWFNIVIYFVDIKKRIKKKKKDTKLKIHYYVYNTFDVNLVGLKPLISIKEVLRLSLSLLVLYVTCNDISVIYESVLDNKHK